MSTGKRVRPTPTPQVAAVVRPALGAVLVSLAVSGCADDASDGDSATGADTTVPPMIGPDDDDGAEAPMPNPTAESGPGDTTGGGTASGDTTDGGTSEGPMPNPDGDSGAPMPPPNDSSSGGSSSGGSSSGEPG